MCVARSFCGCSLSACPDVQHNPPPRPELLSYPPPIPLPYPPPYPPPIPLPYPPPIPLPYPPPYHSHTPPHTTPIPPPIPLPYPPPPIPLPYPPPPPPAAGSCMATSGLTTGTGPTPSATRMAEGATSGCRRGRSRFYDALEVRVASPHRPASPYRLAHGGALGDSMGPRSLRSRSATPPHPEDMRSGSPDPGPYVPQQPAWPHRGLPEVGFGNGRRHFALSSWASWARVPWPVQAST